MFWWSPVVCCLSNKNNHWEQKTQKRICICILTKVFVCGGINDKWNAVLFIVSTHNCTAQDVNLIIWVYKVLHYVCITNLTRPTTSLKCITTHTWCHRKLSTQEIQATRSRIVFVHEKYNYWERMGSWGKHLSLHSQLLGLSLTADRGNRGQLNVKPQCYPNANTFWA